MDCPNPRATTSRKIIELNDAQLFQLEKNFKQDQKLRERLAQMLRNPEMAGYVEEVAIATTVAEENAAVRNGRLIATIVNAGLVLFLVNPGLNQLLERNVWAAIGNPIEYLPGDPGSPAPPPLTSAAKTVVANAAKWKGKQFNPGELAQCAVFVRHVLEASGINIPVTSKPWDDNTGGHNGPAMARSFFGNDIGDRIPSTAIQPGDLVAFTGTYGEWKGTEAITHVGIAVSPTMMIDRPTANSPVKYRAIFGTFPNSKVYAIRPRAYRK